MVPTVPPAVPRRGGPITRAIGRVALQLFGWRIDGELPDCAKFVAIVAPHRSNWDFIIGLAAKFTLAIDASWLGKHTLFRGPWAALFRRWGGIPVDRRAAHDTVASVVARFQDSDHLVLAITPEGTRTPGGSWKSGFWHIANRAGVPIVPVALDWEHRIVRIMPPMEARELESDLRDIQARYSTIRGRNA